MKTFAATVLLIECVIISLYPNTIAQRITTIQLDGTQYFVSRMNPYSPELNYFLAYQYCRSLGLQLISFETREKADSVAQYLSNAGYTNYHFWTSGNRLGTNMYIWQSTGLPFNATFNYMKKETTTAQDVLTSPQRSSRNTDDHKCVAMTGPMFQWEASDCLDIKDFICEQTRCYYYNYGSIPVSSAQGKPLTQTTLRPFYSTSSIPQNDTADAQTDMDNSENQISEEPHPVTVGPYNNDGNQYMAEMQADESHNDNHEDSEYASTIDPMQL